MILDGTNNNGDNAMNNGLNDTKPKWINKGKNGKIKEKGQISNKTLQINNNHTNIKKCWLAYHVYGAGDAAVGNDGDPVVAANDDLLVVGVGLRNHQARRVRVCGQTIENFCGTVKQNWIHP